MGGWKFPPKSKIYEALTAVADGSVKLKGDDTAEVLSSDRTKTYTVEWSADLREITSNDNASYWQRYIGYLIIAPSRVLPARPPKDNLTILNRSQLTGYRKVSQYQSLHGDSW
jgi:hypothetical protein